MSRDQWIDYLLEIGGIATMIYITGAVWYSVFNYEVYIPSSGGFVEMYDNMQNCQLFSYAEAFEFLERLREQVQCESHALFEI